MRNEATTEWIRWSGWRFHQQQQHDHRRFRLDTVAMAGGHVNPGSWFRLVLVVTQAHGRLALEKMKNSRHGGRVFGKLLALGRSRRGPP